MSKIYFQDLWTVKLVYTLWVMTLQALGSSPVKPTKPLRCGKKMKTLLRKRIH